jgi:murein DD-endopeptidase MepM/ murein hydrolase activator NlpD
VVVTERRTPEMLVVLDSDPNSLAPLTIAQRYANGTVLLTSWNADPLEIEAVVQDSATADPTISEALQVAAQRGMPWVGIRRNFAAPQQLLTELMIATARHSHDVVPGFAVFLADGQPAPFRRILAIVDRSDGPISGLLAYAAVAVADTAGAQLDILIVGDADENPHSEDELEALVISREQELYDAAVARARGEGLAVTWITAASVKDLWRVVADQLSQHDYDLVIDDLGAVSLARIGVRDSASGTLADGAAGEIPLKLLTQTDVPLLLVMDEIRLGLAPPGLLKAGAMVAIALGMVVGAGAAAAAAPASASASTEQQDPVGTLIADLEAALGTATEEEAEARRVQDAATTGRGASDDGARAQAEQIVTPPTAYAPQAAAVPSGTEQAAIAAQSQAQSEDRATSEPKPPEAPKAPKPPKPPKGGATPSQVTKAEKQAAKDRAAFEKDKAQRAKTKEAVAEAEAARAEAQTEAAVALADLEAATLSHREAADHAAATLAATTGVAALLPGTPTEEQVVSAQLAEQAAAERLAAAVAIGEEALAALESTEQALADEQATLEERKAQAKETKAEYAQSKEKAEVYQESLAETRQPPMAKGTYRLTARFGQTGGYWSSGVHTGLDFAGPTGTPILAAASGKVVSTGYEGSYGNQVIIDHGDGYQTTYNHLSGVGVSVGVWVSTGDQIGRRGSTGNSTGAHLHFEVTKDGKFIDPEGWLGW